ncbi:alpha-D-ribose 1-methylphosphonate 5-triphosphate diphosphatase [Phenylobacterium sp.]|uniref:alpha-D-ribose 1-methylphosphonate 5-triphosphate diphosphatase n=1 Tax=Phenylobacterium sp. TaxID=1871053 RepID=UPI00272FD5A1|nr:alpha-D-ribose 1-methylphosphonate 5-triphosphate diphosphatase [Phenylobacterium sp.]MDP1619136.1 alpha-D-ribose 1-methylphosphonate 5-triphosphate diphosphatase [Phenylobacterium sp.]MDP1986824.1 alpha-D-ribose 1-methylphosphonate 5-triphosphate diphosphatase [Phenylobacterium sp.]
MELAFRNARVVTGDEDFIGSVLVRDGVIAEVSRGGSAVGEDFEGDVLMPGVVDLHTDSLEKHYFPRPNIDWNPVSAAVTHDGCCLSVGVTTILNSLTLGSFNASAARSTDNLRRLVDGLHDAQDQGMLRADHKIHWRCETTADDLRSRLEVMADHPMTAMFSLMDHTPGQRQYRNLEKHLANWQANGMSEAAALDRLAQVRDRQARNAEGNRTHVAQMAKSRNTPLASHDDESLAHVDEAADLGATVAEFPVTAEAARRARERGMVVVMGGPNLIRGGSYSGNVPAAELAQAELLDAFASDYVPRSLVECAFAMTRAPFNWSLAQAVALVTAGPARAVGLDDRGEIAPGRRADLLRVRLAGDLPLVRGVWTQGARAA